MLNPKSSISVDGSGDIKENIITISAKGSIDVSYTLTLSEEEIRYIRESFINGIYVEGFVVLESLIDDIDLSSNGSLLNGVILIISSLVG
jgi:hypothetical protein